MPNELKVEIKKYHLLTNQVPLDHIHFALRYMLIALRERERERDREREVERKGGSERVRWDCL